MKIHSLLLCLSLIILVVINTGCKKDEVRTYYSNTEPNPVAPDTSDPVAPDTPVPVDPNTPLIAYAGSDRFVFWPVNSVQFNGFCSYSKSSIKEIFWSKISGPGSYVLEDVHALNPKVSLLEKGIYQFELVVEDLENNFDRDTMMVFIGEMPKDLEEIVFKDLEQQCPWYCGVEIQNIYSHLPFGSVFKVYIDLYSSGNWIEVVHEPEWTERNSYWFELYGGNLWISYAGYDENVKPRVKVVY